MRTIVELPETQLQALALFCRREHISQDEAIRRAVDRLVAADEKPVAIQNRQAGFGLWRGQQPGDGRRYVEALRAEWEEGA